LRSCPFDFLSRGCRIRFQGPVRLFIGIALHRRLNRDCLFPLGGWGSFGRHFGFHQSRVLSVTLHRSPRERVGPNSLCVGRRVYLGSAVWRRSRYLYLYSAISGQMASFTCNRDLTITGTPSRPDRSVRFRGWHFTAGGAQVISLLSSHAIQILSRLWLLAAVS